MNILVTGSSGFIGSKLVNKLNHNIVLYDRKNNFRETLDNIDLLRSKLKGIDVVYHLAGISNPRSPYLFQVNTDGTRNLIQAIKDLKQKTKIIFSSTFGVYKVPKKGDVIDECYPIKPRSMYGKSKLEAEKLLLENDQNVVFRFSNVYGPHMLPGEHSVVANLIDAILNERPARIYEKEATRDFVFIDDVVNSLIRPLNLNVGGVFNICTNNETSIFDLAKNIEKISGRKFIFDFSIVSKGSGYWRGSYKKAEDVLNWRPKIDLNKGLSKILK